MSPSPSLPSLFWNIIVSWGLLTFPLFLSLGLGTWPSWGPRALTKFSHSVSFHAQIIFSLCHSFSRWMFWGLSNSWDSLSNFLPGSSTRLLDCNKENTKSSDSSSTEIHFSFIPQSRVSGHAGEGRQLHNVDLGFSYPRISPSRVTVLFHRVTVSERHCDPAGRKGDEEAEGHQLPFRDIREWLSKVLTHPAHVAMPRCQLSWRLWFHIHPPLNDKKWSTFIQMTQGTRTKFIQQTRQVKALCPFPSPPPKCLDILFGGQLAISAIGTSNLTSPELTIFPSHLLLL